MATTKPTSQEHCETEVVKLKPAIQRRILNFLNSAARTKDLMFVPQPVRGLEGPDHEDNPEELNRKVEPIFDEKLAKAIFDKRKASDALVSGTSPSCSGSTGLITVSPA